MSATVLTGTPPTGRVAVVSGASNGMGAATTERLAALGATGGTAHATAVDVTDRDATELMADLIHDIDVLQSEDIAFIATVPRHVNPTEITTLPTAQTI
ncbi:hypothetical protein [Streptomyces sp. MA15]|uniref:hypothetical protein n=1 Tax=Streptomyces sp. MA15 TaxID=3055061 RepID=UPI0025B0285A|nr:hypothetical protein [Streptomyces sp. MA15]MDN3270373.1 hypothetical protein [Streptomyces sp. MA15]